MKKINSIKLSLIVVLGIGFIAYTASASVSIKYTKHNLSNWGQYSVKAQSENQVCIFCHTPHNADSTEAPLWNRNDTTQAFIMATTQWVNWGRPATGADSQPTTISKKCLSCHDGSIAIGDVRKGGPITMAVSSKLDVDGSLKNDATNPFGSYDLRGGHVISFNYNQAYNNMPSPGRRDSFIPWASIASADKVSMFDKQGRMQCHTCHDPHTDRCNDPAKKVGKDPLWRKACNANGNGSVCDTCHNLFAEYTAPDYRF